MRGKQTSVRLRLVDALVDRVNQQNEHRSKTKTNKQQKSII